MTDISLVALAGTQLSETPTLIDDTTGLITVPTLLPVNQNHLATKEYVDQTAAGYVTQGDFDDLTDDLAPKSEIARLQSEIDAKANQTDLETLDAGVLHLTGGLMQGPILWAGTPTADNHLVPKSYVDDQIGSQLEDAMTITTADARYVLLTGDTVTGPIILPADPTTNLQAATKRYVDSRAVDPSLYVQLSGSTMTGPLILSGDPTVNLGAATKQYVDGIADLRLNPELAGFYTSGAIPVHLSHYTVVWDPADSTRIRGWRNRASNSGTYDALVPTGQVGVVYSMEQMLAQFTNGGPKPGFAAPMNISNMHILWAMRYAAPRSGNPHMLGAPDVGQTDPTTNLQSAIRLQTQADGTTRVVVVDGQSGSQQTRALTGYRGTEIFDVVNIWEFFPDYTTRNYRLLMNGASWVNASMNIAADTGFRWQFVGTAINYTGIFNGQIGDVMLVDTSKPDGAAALTFARAYLCNRYGVTLGVLPPAP